MAAAKLDSDVRHSLELGWALTELLGRYNRYLHPYNPGAKEATLERGRLHRLTYTAHEELEDNTYLAYACALRICACIDALGLQGSARETTPDYRETIRGLPGAIRAHQRTGDDNAALHIRPFWEALEDSSGTIRAELHSVRANLAHCFSFAGMLAELYWLLPVDRKGDMISSKEEVAKLHYKINKVRLVLKDDLAHTLPISYRTALSYALDRWYTSARKWGGGPGSQQLEDGEAIHILRALGRQSSKWAIIVLGEKTPDRYLTFRDRACAFTASILPPATVAVLVLIFALKVVWPFGQHVFASTIQPAIGDVAGSGWYKAELGAGDLFATVFTIGSALVSGALSAYAALRWILHWLNHLRLWLLDRLAGRLAGKRILTLPDQSP